MELPQVGEHCQFSSCQILDFLPVACPLCEQIFCGNHRLPLDHHCSEWKRVDKQLVQCETCNNLVKPVDSIIDGSETKASLSSEKALEKHKLSGCKLFLYKTTVNDKINRSCAVDKCQDIDPRVGPVRCESCEKDFCLRHRHPTSHGCPSLNDNEERKLQRKRAAQEKLAETFVPNTTASHKLTTPGSKAQKTIISSSKMDKKGTGMIALMKIKAQAKGNASIPPALRIYLYVQYPEETQLDETPMYFDKKNSVGKTLDQIADYCKVNNKNSSLKASDPMRLELYKCDSKLEPLQDKSQSLEKVFQNLDTIRLERQGKMT